VFKSSFEEGGNYIAGGGPGRGGRPNWELQGEVCSTATKQQLRKKNKKKKKETGDSNGVGGMKCAGRKCPCRVALVLTATKD